MDDQCCHCTGFHLFIYIRKSPELQLSEHIGYPIAFAKAALATFVDKKLQKGNITAVSTRCMAAETQENLYRQGKLLKAIVKVTCWVSLAYRMG